MSHKAAKRLRKAIGHERLEAPKVYKKTNVRLKIGLVAQVGSVMQAARLFEVGGPWADELRALTTTHTVRLDGWHRTYRESKRHYAKLRQGRA